MLDVSPRPVSDDSFVRRLRAGDGEAFEALVRRESPRLLAVARRLLRNEEDAKDAVQDGFVSAFRSLDDFGGRCQVSTWLHRITVNAALMKLRTRRRKPEDSIEDLLPSFLEDGHHARHPHEWRDTGEALLSSQEDREFVRAAIDRLPEMQAHLDHVVADAERPGHLGRVELLDVAQQQHARQALRTLLAPRFEKGDA